MLKERLEKDLREALKQKDEVRLSVLRFLKSDMQNYMIDKKLKELKDEEVMAVIRRQIKRHMESAEQFEKGNRPELAAKERQELEILKLYLPEQLSDEEVRSIVEGLIKELQASGKKDFGRVMKAAMEKAKGRADGKTVSRLVNELMGG